MKPIIILIFLLPLIFILTDEIFAQTPPPISQEKRPVPSEQPVQISADHVIQGKDKDSVMAWGRVKLEHQDKTLWADKVMVNNKTGIGKARGHVILETADGTRLKARESLFDLKSKKGKFFKSKGKIGEQFHIKGKEIERIATDHYILDNASLTTCEGVLPDWEIEAKSVDIINGDRALFKKAILKVKNIPILYIPIGYIPINKKRKTGFLFPIFGINTNAKGFEGVSFNQEFFWAINRWSDVTFQTKRVIGGWQHGVDYRYIASKNELGRINVRVHDDDAPGNSMWNIGMHHSQELTNNFKFKGTLDLESHNSLKQISNDNIVERSKRNTDSYAVVNKIWDNSSLDVITRYKQSTDFTKDDTLAELPKITYKFQRTQIGESPFYFNLNTSSAWFMTDLKPEKDDDHYFKNLRLDFHPQLSLPIPIAPWLSMTNTIGVRETFYEKGLVKDLEAGGVFGAYKKLPSFTRESIDIETSLQGPKFNKIFEFKNSSTKIKHLLGTTFSHSYIPDIDEKDRLKIKVFDGIDTIAPTNSVSYGFGQRLFKKFEVDENKFKIKQILRFNISQSFNIREATKSINIGSGEERKPFGAIRFDLDSRPIDSIILNMDANFDYENNWVNAINLEAGVKPVDNVWVIMERRWTKNSFNYILGTLDISFNPGWRVQYSTRFDEMTSTFRENNLSLLYDNPCKCWGFKFDIIDRQIREADNDRRDYTQFLFSIKLRGLGNLKRGSGTFLHRDFEDSRFPETNFKSKLMN